jgi:hypothetical protein
MRAAFVVLLAVSTLPFLRADDTVSVASLLRQETDFTTLPMHRNWRTNLASSHDPTGGNADAQQFLSFKNGRAVLADLKGPGAIVRFWSTAVYNKPNGQLTSDPSGQLKIYLDDNPTPVIDEPFADFFDQHAPFVQPLTDHYGAATISYLPIPYAKHCVVTLDQPQDQFYQIQSLAFPAGTKVRPFALPLTAEDEGALKAAGKNWMRAAQPAPPSASEMPVGSPLKPGKMDENTTTNSIKPVPGLVTRFWVLTDATNQQLRNLVLRAWFDGHKIPDIEAPIADFFGNAYGRKEFNSFFFSDNGSLNCFFPMPFKQGAHFAIENRNQVPVQVAFGWDIKPHDFTPNTEYFHADFNQEITQPGKPHAWLKIAHEAGHFVGVVQTMQGNHTLGYCEGDGQVRVDEQPWGKSAPQFPDTVVGPWNGTGTEDDFNSAWYFQDGVVARPMNGCLVREDLGRIDTYRFFVNDAPVWQDSIDAQIEHGGLNDSSGEYYSSVAFWYGPGERQPLAPLPADLSFPPEQFSEGDPHNTVIEGESLVETAKATGGKVEVEKMPGLLNVWSGGAQLAWTGAKAGDTLDLTINIPVAGDYSLLAFASHGPDYGAPQYAIAGKYLPWNDQAYTPGEPVNVRQDWGTATLPAGPCHLTIKMLGADAQSKGTRFGLDLLDLHLIKAAR